MSKIPDAKNLMSNIRQKYNVKNIPSANDLYRVSETAPISQEQQAIRRIAALVASNACNDFAAIQ